MASGKAGGLKLRHLALGDRVKEEPIGERLLEKLLST